MIPLPVIVGFGGVNAAGRSSCHHAYRRLVVDSLPKQHALRTWKALAGMMGITYDASGPDETQIAYIREHTLIRRIESHYFDVDRVRVHLRARATVDGARLNVAKNQPLLDEVPDTWQVERDASDGLVINLPADEELMLPHYLPLSARGAGQLPTGFQPGAYGSRQHPRGLEMSVYALSDALNSLGIDWSDLCKRVPPEKISVYSGSAMSQLDPNGNGGMLRSRLLGERISARHCPLGLPEMSADFSNAYVLGTMGNSGSMTGACATLLYNLRLAMHDIRNGDAHIAIVGASEAPIVPDVLASYVAMGALATDENLRKLDNMKSGEPDWRKACRPFANNCGFTIAESAQYFILFSDQLALETGARIYGSVAEVCTNADGYKKSITSPGVGNYLTVARALASARALLGKNALQRSYILAHGTGTPQNRVTESHVLSENAKWFGISSWPVAAIKCFLGHSVATAGGDQLGVALGVWEDGLIPGIATMQQPADDVHCDHLSFSNKDRHVDPENMDIAFINSKGFGGNNATASVISPSRTQALLTKRHGQKNMTRHQHATVPIQERVREYDERALNGDTTYHYSFGTHVYDESSLRCVDKELRFPDGQPPVNLSVPSPYPDLTD